MGTVPKLKKGEFSYAYGRRISKPGCRRHSMIGTSFSGIAGSLITVGVLCGTGYLVKLTRKKEATVNE